MNFELKSVATVGAIIANDDETFTQHLNVVIGVVDCPYSDIKSEKTILYIFDGKLSALDIKAGIDAFAKEWVVTNYPNI